VTVEEFPSVKSPLIMNCDSINRDVSTIISSLGAVGEALGAGLGEVLGEALGAEGEAVGARLGAEGEALGARLGAAVGAGLEVEALVGTKIVGANVGDPGGRVGLNVLESGV